MHGGVSPTPGLSTPSQGRSPTGTTCIHLGPRDGLTHREAPAPGLSPAKSLGEQPLGKVGLGFGLKSLTLVPAWPRSRHWTVEGKRGQGNSSEGPRQPPQPPWL